MSPWLLSACLEVGIIIAVYSDSSLSVSWLLRHVRNDLHAAAEVDAVPSGDVAHVLNFNLQLQRAQMCQDARRRVMQPAIELVANVVELFS